MTKYAIEYRTGGTANGKWRRTLIECDSMTEAEIQCFDIERMGYPTRVVPVEGGAE